MVNLAKLDTKRLKNGLIPFKQTKLSKIQEIM